MVAKYRVTESSFFHDRLYRAGEEVDYDGLPGFNLEAINEEGVAAVKAAVEARERNPAYSEPGFLSEMIVRNLRDGDAMGTGLVPASSQGPNGPDQFPARIAHGPVEPTRDQLASQKMREARIAEEAAQHAREEAVALSAAATAENEREHAAEVQKARDQQLDAQKRADEADKRSKDLQDQLDALKSAKAPEPVTPAAEAAPAQPAVAAPAPAKTGK